VSARVAVVGGGVAGLTTAHRLLGAGMDVVVFERDPVAGGVLAPPVEVGDLALEPGPDSLAARKPWGVALCDELGVGSEEPDASGAFLWTPAGLVPTLRGAPFGIPGDVGDVLRWPGLSSRGRFRALGDLVIRKRSSGAPEETLGGLLRRRLGDEATDLALAPLLAGLHAGDVDRLSAAATFPELVAWEAAQGSLIRGAQAAERAARRVDAGPLFRRPRGGMRALVDALADPLGVRLVTGADVIGVDAHEVRLRDGVEPVDAVVLACRVGAAAEILAAAAPPELRATRSVSTAVVFLCYPSGTADALPDGTGFVVPRGAAPMTAVTFLSRKWPDPAFADRAVVRCYVGGDGAEDVVEEADADIVDACARHLSAALDLPASAASRVHRWRAAMPQYEVGHLARVQAIRDAMPPGIFVVGCDLDGVGVSDLVRAAGETAERVLAHVGEPRKEPA
jgi:protoporphyrinogen/coproporphyrinogen III oxidase